MLKKMILVTTVTIGLTGSAMANLDNGLTDRIEAELSVEGGHAVELSFSHLSGCGDMLNCLHRHKTEGGLNLLKYRNCHGGGASSLCNDFIDNG